MFHSESQQFAHQLDNREKHIIWNHALLNVATYQAPDKVNVKVKFLRW